MRIQPMPYRGYKPTGEERAAWLAEVKTTVNGTETFIAVVSNYSTAIQSLLAEVRELQDENKKLQEKLDAFVYSEG